MVFMASPPGGRGGCDACHDLLGVVRPAIPSGGDLLEKPQATDEGVGRSGVGVEDGDAVRDLGGVDVAAELQVAGEAVGVKADVGPEPVRDAL